MKTSLKELAESCNHGDALVNLTRKSLGEYCDKLDAGEKEKIEAAIGALETALTFTLMPVGSTS